MTVQIPAFIQAISFWKRWPVGQPIDRATLSETVPDPGPESAEGSFEELSTKERRRRTRVRVREVVPRGDAEFQGPHQDVKDVDWSEGHL